ncbi:ABC transporter ATP-binding protein [Prosthecobacter sp. SYSU 5D2]|uniref:ABC transporter ATP-binding protein n=1 Tax=Prosthecobacter sp. SYSU 5D2 TaxID=3134134 RepID=UPI0031FEF639
MSELAAHAPAVTVENLTKVFKGGLGKKAFVAVQDLSLEVKSGEVYGLIGPNGSGKSTTMKAILGLLAPTRGRTTIFGRSSTEVASRTEVGFLPENPYFYKHLNGMETLLFYGRLCSMGGKELKDRAREMLALTGLEDAADRRVAGYSKGMLQRLGLAQALLHRPRLIVLDEPTAGVDPAGSRKIRDLVLGFKKEGITVLVTSHLLEQMQEVCDRVGIMAHGKMMREGRVDELIAVENHTELVLEDASPELLAEITRLVERSGQAKLIRSGHPRTTLERLFLEATEEAAPGAAASRPDGKR